MFFSSVYAQKGRIYGEVESRRGEKYKGWIKWDGKQTVWDDLFRGQRELRYIKRDRSNRTSRKYEKVDTRIKFGYIQNIEYVYSKVALLKLKDGREMELENYNANQGIIVLDNDLGEVKISRKNLRRISFMQEPPDYEKNAYPRALPLYGELQTRFGKTYKGYIMWDVDESLATDILDGKDQEGVSRKIAMGKIKSIQPFWSDSKITFKSGRVIELGGSNDVNRENRGILVRMPDRFQIEVEWRDFEKLTFLDDYKAKSYNDYKPAQRLTGTLQTYDGSKHEGFITWDYDEAYTCDILDGDFNKMEVKIEFGHIKEIKYNSGRSVKVTLKTGEILLLRGGNDVDSSNKGIVVTKTVDGKDERIFDWDEFDNIIFK
jgi:hypothetical protein